MLPGDFKPHLLEIRFNGDFILSHSFEATIADQRLGNAVFYFTLFSSCMQRLYHKVIFKTLQVDNVRFFNSLCMTSIYVSFPMC